MILVLSCIYHANSGIDETKGSTLNTKLTEHATEQLTRRTGLHPSEVVDILDHGITTPLGLEKGSSRMHILFYSPVDDTCFVAVRDAETNQVITVLPVDYDRRNKVDHSTVVPELINRHKPVTETSHAQVVKAGVNKTAKSVYLKVTIINLNGGRRFATLKLSIAQFGEDKEALEKDEQVKGLLEELVRGGIKTDSEYVGMILFQRGCHGEATKFNLSLDC